MDYKQLRHNFINYLKDNYNYARPEVMASNVFYVWHNNIGIDFLDIFKSDESMERAKELLIKKFEKTGRKNPRGHAGVHYGCWQKFQEFLMKQQDSCYVEVKDINQAEYLDTYTVPSEFDLLTAMDNLSLKRKLFHSEADFQFALAWEIQTLYPEAAVRLEYCPREAPHMHIDIVVELDDKVYPIELKYKTLKLDCPIDGEYYNLKNHGAQDIGKYDCLLDIQRMEQCRKILSQFECGFTIWLTNDPLYWTPAKKPGTMAEEFTLHEGVNKSGTMRWAAHTSVGTQKGREEPISLHGSYSIHWRDYSEISETRAGKFQYVLLSINQDCIRTN